MNIRIDTIAGTYSGVLNVMGMWSEWRGPRSRWSRSTKIVAFVASAVIAIVSVIAIGYLGERASAATPVDARSTSVAAVALGTAPDPNVVVYPPSGGDRSCESWAKRQVQKFKNGRTGNSAGIQKKLMPKKKWNRLMRDAVKRYQKHHPEQVRGEPRSWSQPRGWGDWCPVCDYFFEAERCMSTGLHPSGCAEAKEDSEEIHRIGEKVAKFTLVCGGGAVMGAGLG